MNSLLKLIVAGTAIPAILLAATETASAQMAMPDACKSASSMSGDMKIAGFGNSRTWIPLNPGQRFH